MAPKEPVAEKQFTGLPLLIVGPVEIGRLNRELEMIDNVLLQQGLQNQPLQLPQITKTMDAMVGLNKLDLLDAAHRQRAKEFLRVLHEKAPVLHMSFSADPSAAFIEKVLAWLRQNVHPLVLLTIGLQPNIGAGCIMRGTNKYFDFSLGHRLQESREVLMQKLSEPLPDEVVPEPLLAAAGSTQ